MPTLRRDFRLPVIPGFFAPMAYSAVAGLYTYIGARAVAGWTGDAHLVGVAWGGLAGMLAVTWFESRWFRLCEKVWLDTQPEPQPAPEPELEPPAQRIRNLAPNMYSQSEQVIVRDDPKFTVRFYRVEITDEQLAAIVNLIKTGRTALTVNALARQPHKFFTPGELNDLQDDLVLQGLAIRRGRGEVHITKKGACVIRAKQTQARSPAARVKRAFGMI